MPDAVTLIPLSVIDPAMVELVLDRAFGPERQARTAYRIRGEGQPLDALSFAALDNNELLVGTIQCWPIALRTPDRDGASGARIPLVMVGPVAVLPERQGEGFGQGLMAAMLGAQALMETAPLPQVLIGDADYYGRWGFSAMHTGGWRCPGPYRPKRLLARGSAVSTLPATGMLGPWEIG